MLSPCRLDIGTIKVLGDMSTSALILWGEAYRGVSGLGALNPLTAARKVSSDQLTRSLRAGY